MKKLLYGFIFSLMLFSYADAQIATDQIYGGVYTKAETENKIADGVDEATALIVTSFDGFLTAADDTVQKALDTIDNLKSIIYTKTEVDSAIETAIEAAIAAIPAGGGTAIEDIGTYIESNTTWEFDADYDTTAVCIYRNRIYQPRSLFTTVDVSSKTRVVFTSAINASDEIILISNK